MVIWCFIRCAISYYKIGALWKPKTSYSLLLWPVPITPDWSVGSPAPYHLKCLSRCTRSLQGPTPNRWRTRSLAGAPSTNWRNFTVSSIISERQNPTFQLFCISTSIMHSTQWVTEQTSSLLKLVVFARRNLVEMALFRRMYVGSFLVMSNKYGSRAACVLSRGAMQGAQPSPKSYTVVTLPMLSSDTSTGAALLQILEPPCYRYYRALWFWWFLLTITTWKQTALMQYQPWISRCN